MPKFKQPASLEKLAVECLGRTVGQKTAEAIRSRTNLNTSALNDYLYGELPDVLSQEVTAHMLAKVSWTLIRENEVYRVTSDTEKSVLLAVLSRRMRVLDLTNNTPEYAVVTMCSNLQTFTKLQTLIVRYDFLADDVVETLPAGLSSLKVLAHFEMAIYCTDAVIETLGSCCFATIEHIDVRYSKQVTDASFKALLECRKLTHFAICGTSATAEGFLQDLQHWKCDVTAKGLRGLGVGSKNGWDVSSPHLNTIALRCPMLKCLQICRLRADMEELVSLTKLEALSVVDGQFDKCNLDGFLRVRGCNITSLDLYRTESIDLACIVNHCAYIRTIYVQEGRVIMGNSEIAPNACQYLETLHLRCEFSPSAIEGVLYACVNLTTLCLCRSNEHITDRLILRVLSKNPLQKLSSFSASCHEVTMRAVDAIIQQCPLLEELQCHDCDRMTEAEVDILQQKIENGNLDLNAGFSAMHFPW